jgi:hypothetical protein
LRAFVWLYYFPEDAPSTIMSLRVATVFYCLPPAVNPSSFGVPCPPYRWFLCFYADGGNRLSKLDGVIVAIIGLLAPVQCRRLVAFNIVLE